MDKHTIAGFGVFILSFTISPLCASAELRIDCPAKLERDAVQITTVPEGWGAYTPDFLRLHSVGVMFGAPSTGLEAKPYSDVNRKDGHTARWTFSEDDEKWISCQYGHGGELMLTKKLSEKTTACTAIYTKNKFGQMDIDFRCTSS
ncbi:MAG: STY0301 family protein [Pseudomonadota bacterium]